MVTFINHLHKRYIENAEKPIILIWLDHWLIHLEVVGKKNFFRYIKSLCKDSCGSYISMLQSDGITYVDKTEILNKHFSQYLRMMIILQLQTLVLVHIPSFDTSVEEVYNLLGHRATGPAWRYPTQTIKRYIWHLSYLLV